MKRLECSKCVIKISIAQQTGFLTGLKMGVNIASCEPYYLCATVQLALYLPRTMSVNF